MLVCAERLSELQYSKRSRRAMCSAAAVLFTRLEWVLDGSSASRNARKSVVS